MAPEPIPKTILWTDPKHLPEAVNGVFTAAGDLFAPLQRADTLEPEVFGDLLFQVRNFHAEMNTLMDDASTDTEELGISITASLESYGVSDVGGGGSIAAAGGTAPPAIDGTASVPGVTIPAPDVPSVTAPVPDALDPVVVPPSQ
ncbi:hypothetical protein AB0L82_32370 [Nocardia sp. NPDC052001]|uniref:hypothetical protein n=1 Tax=Nocardia sp. NPDC052001 TaxID=3154853 RepID=UPI0034250A75